MKKFVFTLETPLRVKKTREKQTEGELSAAIQRQRQFQEERDHLSARFHNASEALAIRLEQGGLTLTDLKIHSSGFTALRRRITEADQKVDAAESEVIRVTRRLQTLVRERKVLEEVREQQLAAYRIEAERDQDRQIDDFISSQRAMSMRRTPPYGQEQR